MFGRLPLFNMPYPNLNRYKTNKYIDFRDYNPSLDGDSSDTDKLIQAFSDANSTNLPLSLPAGTININKAITNICSFYGIPGKTILQINSVVDTAGAGSTGHVLQTAWVRNYNESTAKSLFIKDIIVTDEPGQNISVFGFTNIKNLLIDNVGITATTVLNGSSIPWRVDALIDLYAAVKNTRITNCDLKNITYAHGNSGILEAGGGAEIWVRNLNGSSASGADLTNATENIQIDHCRFTHSTSDEGLAVFGVIGMVRKVKIHDNFFHSPIYNETYLTYHNTLVSAFPLAHATLGVNASVEDVDFYNNYIDDKNWLYNIVRFGNSTDTAATNISRRLRSYNNNVVAYRSPDATYGPQAAWIAAGSIGIDPSISNGVFRAIAPNGTWGAFKNAGITSSGDVVTSNGDSIFYAFNGFDSIDNPVMHGAIWQAVSNCNSVIGGDIECTNTAYQNCRSVTGGAAKTNDSGGYIFDVQSGYTNYNYTGVKFIATGALMHIDTTSIDAFINMTGCNGSAGDITKYAITNDSTTSKMRLHCNQITGSMAGIKTGDGAANVTSSLNTYGSTTD